MKIEIKQDNFFDDNEKNCIILKSEERIIVRGENEDDYIIMKCTVEGKLLITTNLIQDMEEYNLVKVSQKLLGYPILRRAAEMKKAVCREEN